MSWSVLEIPDTLAWIPVDGQRGIPGSNSTPYLDAGKIKAVAGKKCSIYVSASARADLSGLYECRFRAQKIGVVRLLMDGAKLVLVGTSNRRMITAYKKIMRCSKR